MTISYDVTADDVLTFTRHILARPAFSRAYRRGFLAGPALGALFLLATRFSSVPVAILKFLLVVLLFSALDVRIYRKQVASQAQRAYAGEGGPLGQKTLSITAEGLQEKGAHSTVSHTWSGIESVEETREAIYLNVAGGAGYIIPKRALAGDPTADEFLATVARYRATGKR